MNKITSVLAAVLVIGSASVALADDYTDQAADALRSYGPLVNHQTMTTRPVGLPRYKVLNSESSWMDHASQTFGGGY
jgi:hypothetical protein